MILNISYLYICLVLLFYCFVFFSKPKLKTQTVFVSLLIFAIALSYVAYCIQPPIGWDLYRHFAELDRIREGGIKYLFSYNSLYHNQKGSAFLFYLVSLQPNNHILPMISVFINYMIFAYIVTDYYKTNNVTAEYVFVAIAIRFILGDITWAFSMIRQPLACSICALAAYVDVYKKKRMGFLLYFVALAIHSGCIAMVLIRLLFKSDNLHAFVRFLYIVWGAFAGIIASSLLKVKYVWVSYFGAMLKNYISIFNVTADKRFFSMKIIFLGMLLFFTLKYLSKNKQRSELRNYTLLFIDTVLFTIGGLVSMQIFMRYALQVGYMSAPMADLVSQKSRAYRVRVFEIVLLFFLIGSIAYQIAALTLHGVVIGGN